MKKVCVNICPDKSPFQIQVSVLFKISDISSYFCCFSSAIEMAMDCGGKRGGDGCGAKAIEQSDKLGSTLQCHQHQYCTLLSTAPVLYISINSTTTTIQYQQNQYCQGCILLSLQGRNYVFPQNLICFINGAKYHW
jgi:hypothetical protein